MNTEKGFTLIELITVMVIIAVLVAISVASGRDWVIRYKIEGQARQMLADLLNARVSAMQKNRYVFVVLSANQYSIYEDTNGNGVLDTGGADSLVRQASAQYGLNFTSANFSFDQNGLTSLSSGTIWLSYTSGSPPLADCIALASTRVAIGKMNGTTCTVQ